MNQIIIFTRITNHPGKNEFRKLFKKDAKEPVTNKSGNFHIYIYDGSNVHDDKPSVIAENIFKKIDQPEREILLIAHYSIGFDDLLNELNNLKGKANWQIRTYSSEDDDYDKKFTLFECVPKDRSKIEEIYKLFSRDQALEENIKLLDTIRSGELMPEKLNEKIKEFQPSYDKFMENKIDYFSEMQKLGNETGDEKEKAEKALKEYGDAHDEFYYSLKLDN